MGSLPERLSSTSLPSSTARWKFCGMHHDSRRFNTWFCCFATLATVIRQEECNSAGAVECLRRDSEAGANLRRTGFLTLTLDSCS